MSGFLSITHTILLYVLTVVALDINFVELFNIKYQRLVQQHNLRKGPVTFSMRKLIYEVFYSKLSIRLLPF